ncbi:MAG: hypothetical protein ACNYPH_05630 [Gammaproteobacteria bacterium WSBS_2016_MAG_OTU1]
MSHYRYSGSKRPLSADKVREKDEETQIDIMKEWFYDNFENPDEIFYMEEDDYLYINGGPYDPYDVLRKEFYNIVSEDFILILAEQLYDIQRNWDPAPGGNYYNDDTEDYPFGQFDEAMKNINILLSTEFHNTSSGAMSSMHRLLYANIIIAIEVYLSDTFKNEVTDNDSVTRRFVETTSFFKEQKISISDIYNNMDSIKNRVNDYLTTFLWHRLKETKKMYENTFSIKFPENIKTINKAIRIHHDIIHRNGKTKDDKFHTIDETDVRDLIAEAQEFVFCVEEKMKKFRLKITILPQTAPEHSPANQNASDN